MSFIKKSLHYLIKVPRSALNKFLDNKSFGKSFLVFLLFMMLIFYYGSLSFFRPLDESWITTSIPKAPVQNPFWSSRGMGQQCCFLFLWSRGMDLSITFPLFSFSTSKKRMNLLTFFQGYSLLGSL